MKTAVEYLRMLAFVSLLAIAFTQFLSVVAG